MQWVFHHQGHGSKIFVMCLWASCLGWVHIGLFKYQSHLNHPETYTVSEDDWEGWQKDHPLYLSFRWSWNVIHWLKYRANCCEILGRDSATSIHAQYSELLLNLKQLIPISVTWLCMWLKWITTYADMVWISVCTDTVILANYFSNLIKIAPWLI